MYLCLFNNKLKARTYFLANAVFVKQWYLGVENSQNIYQQAQKASFTAKKREL
tara:strand:- start:2764 stop:2922 length:159 start_codon:yes stop_codon:yes gene_type:complete